MSFKKYSSLLVFVMLMVIAKPARPAAIDEFEAPEEGKRSEAQMYYELIPVESELKIFCCVLNRFYIT